MDVFIFTNPEVGNKTSRTAQPVLTLTYKLGFDEAISFFLFLNIAFSLFCPARTLNAFPSAVLAGGRFLSFEEKPA